MLFIYRPVTNFDVDVLHKKLPRNISQQFWRILKFISPDTDRSIDMFDIRHCRTSVFGLPDIQHTSQADIRPAKLEYIATFNLNSGNYSMIMHHLIYPTKKTEWQRTCGRGN